MLKLLKNLLLLGILLAALIGGLFTWLVLSPAALKSSPLDFEIAAGSSLRTSARQIADAGIDIHPLVFIALGKAMRVEASIKAGSYEVTAGVTDRKAHV